MFTNKIVLSILFAIALFYSGFSQTILTAEEAIKIGLANNYNIQIARANAEIAGNNAGNGTAGFLPSVTASGSFALTSTDQTTTPANAFSGIGVTDTEVLNGQIALNWVLFDGFRMFTNNRQFKALAAQGEAASRAQIEGTVVAILSAYFSTVQQKQLLEVQQEAVEISKQRLEQAQIRRDFGGASSTDLLNAKVSLNNDRTSLFNQEISFTSAIQNLNIQLAQDPSTPIEVSATIILPELSDDFENLYSMAMENNSGLQAAIFSKSAASAGIGSARSAFFPQVSLNASYGKREQTTENEVFNDFRLESSTNNTTTGTVSLGLNWNIFNGFRDNIAVQNAKIQKRIADLQIKNTENQLKGTLREAYERYLKQLELVKLAQENLTAARQNLELQLERQQLGSATSLEFRDAQVNLLRVQTALVSARFQARVTRLQIDQLTGQLQIQ